MKQTINDPGASLLSVFGLLFLLASCFLGLILSQPSLIIPFLITVCCALVILRPDWSYFLSLIFIFIPSVFFELIQNDKLRIEFFDLFILFSALSWCFRGMARDREPYSYNHIDLLVILFYTWALTSLIWATSNVQGVFEMMKLVTAVGLYLLTKSLVVNRDILRKLIVLLTIVAVFEAILSIISVWIDTGYDWDQPVSSSIDFVSRFWAKKNWGSDGGRGTGTAVAHTTGFLLNMAIFPALGCFFVSKSIKEKWIWAISLIIMSAGMTSTLTKSSMASFLAGSVLIIFHIRKLRKYFVISCLLLLVFFIAVSAISRLRDIEKSINFTSHQMDSSDDETSMGTRLDWWGEGLEKLIDSAWLGYGVGGFRAAINNVVPDGSHHAVLFDLGLIGFSIYIFILAYSFLYYYEHLKRCRDEYFRKLMVAYLAGFLVMVVSWFVTLYYTYPYVWFYMGLGYAIVDLSNKGEDDQTEKPLTNSFIATLKDPVE